MNSFSGSPRPPSPKSKPHYCVLKYIEEPAPPSPGPTHCLPVLRIQVYVGFCFYCLPGPARLYSSCEVHCLAVCLIPISLDLMKVCQRLTPSCFLVDQLQVRSVGNFCLTGSHFGETLLNFIYKPQNWSLRSQPLNRKVPNQDLPFNIN